MGRPSPGFPSLAPSTSPHGSFSITPAAWRAGAPNSCGDPTGEPSHAPRVPSAAVSQSQRRPGPSASPAAGSREPPWVAKSLGDPHVRGRRRGRTHGQGVSAALRQPASSPKLIRCGRGSLSCGTEPGSPARSQSLVPGRASPSFTAESSLHQGQPRCQRSPTSLISDRDRAGGSPGPRGGARR